MLVGGGTANMYKVGSGRLHGGYHGTAPRFRKLLGNLDEGDDGCGK